MTVLGSQTTGISTDEPGHVRRINAYLDSGLYVRNFEVRGTPVGEVPLGAYVYGPATSLLMHAVNCALDNEWWDRAGAWSGPYAVRHGVVAFLSIVGMLAAAGIASLILGNWRWGVVAGGVLAAIPLWTGHGMFNPKDTPVASGHTMITLGLITLALAKPTTKHLTIVFSALALTAGTVLMIGTRPGAWPSLLASLLVFSVVVARAEDGRTATHLGRVVGVAVASLVLAYAALWAIYPRIFSEPFTALTKSAFASSGYQGLGHYPPSGRSYLFRHALIDLPLGLLVLMIAGIAASIFLIGIQRRRSSQLDCLALVGCQAFALTTAAVLVDSVLYHGLRQVLFAIPALAVLATVGLAALLTWSRPGRWRRGMATAACCALILPTAVQAAMFPYQYAYINVAAEQSGVRSDADYFGTSFREYAFKRPQHVKIVCPFLRFGGHVKRNGPDCRTRFAHTFSAYWYGRPALDLPRNNEFYALLRGSRPTPPNCEVYRQVERWQNMEMTVMSRMFKCHKPTTAELRESLAMRNREVLRQGFDEPPWKWRGASGAGLSHGSHGG